MKKQYVVMAGVLMLSLSAVLGGCKKQETVTPTTVAVTTTAEDKEETLADVVTGVGSNTETEEIDKEFSVDTPTNEAGEVIDSAEQSTEETLSKEIQEEIDMYEAGEVMGAEGENGEPAEKQEIVLRGTITAKGNNEYTMTSDDGVEMILKVSEDTKVGDGVDIGVAVEMKCNGVMTRSLPAQVPAVYSIITAEQADEEFKAEMESLKEIEDAEFEEKEVLGENEEADGEAGSKEDLETVTEAN